MSIIHTISIINFSISSVTDITGEIVDSVATVTRKKMENMVTNLVGDFTVANVTASSNSTQLGDFVFNRTGCVELSFADLARHTCNPPDALLPKVTRELIENVIYVGIVPLLTVLAVVVNIMNMAVFVKQGLGDRVHLSLFCLSMADFMVVSSLFLRYLNKPLVLIFDQAWVNKEWLSPIIRYGLLNIPSTFQHMTILISIVIAVERCLCVAWPLHAARALSTRVTGSTILISTIILFAAKRLLALKYDLGCGVIIGTNIELPIPVQSNLYRKIPQLMDILDFLVFSLLVPIFAFLITATATTITTIKLKRATAWRDSNARNQGSDVINRQEKALTMMIIVISCVYMICISPQVVTPLCQLFIPELSIWDRFCNLLIIMTGIANITMAVNSTANFVVYYTMGSRFKQTLHQLLTRATRQKQENVPRMVNAI